MTSNLILTKLFAGAPVRAVIHEQRLWYVALDVGHAFGVKQPHMLKFGIPKKWQARARIHSQKKGVHVRSSQTMLIVSLEAVIMCAGRSHSRPLQELLAEELGRLMHEHLAHEGLVIGGTPDARPWRSSRDKTPSKEG